MPPSPGAAQYEALSREDTHGRVAVIACGIAQNITFSNAGSDAVGWLGGYGRHLVIAQISAGRKPAPPHLNFNLSLVVERRVRRLVETDEQGALFYGYDRNCQWACRRGAWHAL